jgi:arsenate reductase-like glutaredoxin family protein
MPIQIFGRKKCRDTQKALRFFSDRRIPVHFVDLAIKSISPGEIDAIARAIPWERLLDEGSADWRDNRLDRMLMEPKEKLVKHPGILRTPIVRLGRAAVAGNEPSHWQAMAEEAQRG